MLFAAWENKERSCASAQGTMILRQAIPYEKSEYFEKTDNGIRYRAGTYDSRNYHMYLIACEAEVHYQRLLSAECNVSYVY